MMPSQSLAALLAVSRTHRKQVHEHVKHIAVPNREHVEDLVQGNWPRLLTWQIGASMRVFPAVGAEAIRVYSLPNASDAAITLLAKGHLSKLRHLQLWKGFMSAASIAQIRHAGWSSLQSCSLHSVGLSSAAIQAFCAQPWPFLERFDLNDNWMDTADMTYIPSAEWPCLRELDLSCTGLCHEGFHQLSFTYWPVLSDLNVSGNNLGNVSIALLAQLQRTARQVVGWSDSTGRGSCRLKRVNMSGNSLTKATVEQLTKPYWPQLEWLYHRNSFRNATMRNSIVLTWLCGTGPQALCFY
ncbi:hypothetical protein ABBQ32_005234 [Trebouxia sp. C0010 RCD-2024]